MFFILKINNLYHFIVFCQLEKKKESWFWLSFFNTFFTVLFWATI